jgi:hypothetical protein
MDTSEKHEKQEEAETTGRKYQLKFQQRAGKNNYEFQAEITKPSEYSTVNVTLHILC